MIGMLSIFVPTTHSFFPFLAELGSIPATLYTKAQVLHAIQVAEEKYPEKFATKCTLERLATDPNVDVVRLESYIHNGNRTAIVQYRTRF